MNVLKRILVFVFFALSFVSNAQQKQWNILFYTNELALGCIGDTWDTYILRTEADTTYNDTSYSSLCQYSDTTFSEPTYIGGIRESDQKIYYRPYLGTFPPNIEILLYDFSLEQGDSVFLPSTDTYKPGYEYLAKVDSVGEYNLAGKQLKSLYISYYCARDGEVNYGRDKENDVWVESIGSIKRGLLRYTCQCVTPCSSEEILLCHKLEEQLIYQNADFNTCYHSEVLSNNFFSSKGNRWRYSMMENPQEKEGHIELKAMGGYHRINNVDCRAFEKLYYNANGELYDKEEFYTRQCGGVIEYWHDNEFRPWYNFNVNVGDTMPIYSPKTFCPNETNHYGKVVIDSISIVDVFDMPFRAFHSSPTSTSLYSYPGPFIEFIGGTWGMYPVDAKNCLEEYNSQPALLRCFYKEEFGQAFFNGYSTCDNMGTAIIQANDAALQFSYSSESGIFNLSDDADLYSVYSLRIYDSMGRLQIDECFTNHYLEISSYNFKSGVYVACLMLDSKMVGQLKFIAE